MVSLSNKAHDAALDRVLNRKTKKDSDYSYLLKKMIEDEVYKGVLERLNHEEIRELFVRGASFIVEDSMLEVDTVVLFLNIFRTLSADISERNYRAIGLTFVTSELIESYRALRMVDWVALCIKQDAVFNPESLPELFIEHHESAREYDYRDSCEVSHVNLILPHVYKNREVMDSLRKTEASLGKYVAAVEMNPQFGMPLILSDLSLEKSLFKMILEGKESVDGVSGKIINLSLEHEIGLSSEVPFSLKLPLLKQLVGKAQKG